MDSRTEDVTIFLKIFLTISIASVVILGTQNHILRITTQRTLKTSKRYHDILKTFLIRLDLDMCGNSYRLI